MLVPHWWLPNRSTYVVFATYLLHATAINDTCVPTPPVTRATCVTACLPRPVTSRVIFARYTIRSTSMFVICAVIDLSETVI